MSVRLEELLSHLGSPGRFQVLAGVLLIAHTLLFVSTNFGLPFMGITPKHRCKLPANWTWPLNVSIPMTRDSIGNPTSDSCHLYKNPDQPEHGTFACPEGYEWTTDVENQWTIVQEWELVCDRRYLVRVYQSAFFFGVLSGGFVVPPLADRFGRKRIIVSTLIFQAIVALISYFVHDFIAATGLLALRGFAMVGLQVTSISLYLEQFPMKYRTKAGVIGFTQSSFAAPVASIFFFFFPKWDTYYLMMSTPSWLLILAVWFIPESLRWLLCTQQVKKAVALIDRILKFNNLKLPFNVETEAESISEQLWLEKQNQIRERIVDVFKYRSFRTRAIIFWICSFIGQMMAYGPAFLVPKLGGNVHVMMNVIAFADLLARMSSYFVLKRIGRCWTLVMVQIGVGVTCLACCACQATMSDSALFIPQLILMMIMRVFIAIFWVVFTLYVNELFPTTVRTACYGISYSIGRFGAALAPLVLLLGDYLWIGLPFFVFGILGIFSGILNVYLPETTNRPLPSSLREAANISKSEGNTKAALHLLYGESQLMSYSKNSVLKPVSPSTDV